MGLIRMAAILALDNRFRTPSLELKCLGMSLGGQKLSFQSPGTQLVNTIFSFGSCTLGLGGHVFFSSARAQC